MKNYRQINFLKREIDRLNDIIGLLEKLTEDELNEKQGIINGLTIQKGDLQTQLDDKKQKLNKWTDQFPNQQTPATVQGRINTLIGERDNRPNITLQQWNTDYSQRPTQFQYNQLLGERNLLNGQLTTANNSITQKDIQINSLTQQVNILNNQLTTTRNELEREKGWWDKWINDEKDFLCSTTANDKFYLFIKWPQYRFSIFDFFIPGISNFDNTTDILSFKEFKGLGLFFDREQHELNKDLLENSSRSFKEMIKRKVYQYYRDE